ncbi:hypothetical protein FHL15_006268 [Xylaria flabelliformis]|uniref:SRR1-like domain-containing protein n=1 Tax=Xylaria flabelliformis TaxID=2512241 RepID=A0A553HY51_9PEZI|nr:hypothetical protein FHL15_006268 [Xylaria flabelliformis]
MSTIATLVDPLGKMFTPDEKRLLRGRNPGPKETRDRLVVRLADVFTFRRAPRGWQPPFNCFEKAALPENVETFPCGLPAISQADLARANEVMKYAGSRICTSSTFSGVTVDELKEILRFSQCVWARDGRDRIFATIINNIPNNTDINKIVCIGLSEIAIRFDPSSEVPTVISRGLAQHLAVISMVRYLRDLVSHKVELFAADWNYDTPHEQALELLGFTILDASYGKQEHFTAIDDNTMLIAFSIADFESILPIISEYARPIAMIYDAYDYLIDESQIRPPLSPVWSRVKYNDAWITIPGPPLVNTKAPTSTGTADPTTQMPSWVSFYTESTGQMLEEYRIAMNMFDLDVTKLANRFELHPQADYRPRDANETEEKRFAGKNSRLFVRK